ASEEAHRTSAYAICLLSKGALQLETNLFVQKVQAPAVFTISPSTIRKFTDLGASYDARIFFFRKEVFLDGRADVNYLDKFDFFEKTGQQVMALNPEELQKFNTLFDLVHEKSFDTGPHTSSIIQSMINIILNELDEIHQNHANEQAPSTENQ